MTVRPADVYKRQAEHIPSEEITEEKILDYLAALDCGVKANCGQSLNLSLIHI